MRLCSYCGHRTFGPGLLCAYHTDPGDGDDWATGNRIMCDFVHRGIVARGTREHTPAGSAASATADADRDLVAAAGR
jgi:hypothetical protein